LDLKLKINKLNLHPGAKADTQILKNSEFRPAGFVRRFIQRLPREQEIFETKNCTVKCFDDRLSLYPCTHSYLDHDRQWETSASLLLVNGQLQKVEFRVLNGIYAAPNFMKKFQVICNEFYGQPEQFQHNQLIWTNGKLNFSGFLHADKITADFSIECLED